MAQREIPLRRRDGSVRGYALVDDEDLERLNEFKWHLDEDGYARRNIFVEGKYKTIMMHREIMGFVAGDRADLQENLRRGCLDQVATR